MIAYTIGMFDILRMKDLRDLDRNIQLSSQEGYKAFALGIYTDQLCEALGINKPLKSLEERMEIAKNLRGVDFVFSVSSLDTKIIKNKLKEQYYKNEEQKKMYNKDDKSKKKEFDLSYAPGTYDLFHTGHLENLLEAASRSERLIVGIKSDELVQKHKHKSPIIPEEERMEILRHFRFVDDVYIYYTRDLHIANDWIKSKQGKGFDAVFLGSDLKADFKDVKGINIIFTDRDEETMKSRSTTSYAKKYKTLSLDKDNHQNFTGKIELSSRLKNNENEKTETSQFSKRNRFHRLTIT